MRTRRLAPLFAGLVLAAAACSDGAPLAPDRTESRAGRAAVQTINGVRQVEGEIGPGAKYALFVPDAWNGKLVLYSHGFRDTDVPVDLRDQDNLYGIRQRLTDQGYAVGYSSYSEQGYAIKDGMQRTHQLRGIFASHFSKPAKTLLMGHSMGGLIALGLAERFPQHYDGALVMCGITGGSPATVDYIAHIRVLFDFFYPGVLPGDLLNMPAGTRPMEDVVGPAQAAMTASLAQGSAASLQGALAIAAIMEEMGTPIPFIREAGQQTLVQTLVGSIVYSLGFHARGFEDLIDRTHGRSPFDNTQTVYGSAALPQPLLATLNAGVDRFATTPDAQNYLAKYYAPTGNLQIPVLCCTAP